MPEYLISTTMGNARVDDDEPVYTQVDDSHFVRKRPDDLNVGEMILFPKRFTSTHLEDVEGYLFRYPRYASAWDMLHERDSEGRRVTKVRTMLIRGLRDHGFFGSADPAEIERKMMMEDGEDFTRDEYRAMTEYIGDLLARHNLFIGGSTPYGWLRGFTVAPFGFTREGERIMNALGQELNPELLEWRYGNQDHKSPYFNYQLFTKVRRGVMWWLNECRGMHEGSEERERPERDSITLSPEYSIIFRHFFRDLSHDLATTRITEIERLKPDRQVSHRERASFSLGDGIVREALEYIEAALKPCRQAVEEEEIMKSYLEAAFENFDLESAAVPVEGLERGSSVTPNRFARYHFFNFTLPYLLEYFGEDLDSEMRFIMRSNDRFDESEDVDEISFRRNFARVFKDLIFSGDFDAYYSFDRGTMMNLLGTHYRLRRAIPKRVFRYVAQCRRYNISYRPIDPRWHTDSHGKPIGVAKKPLLKKGIARDKKRKAKAELSRIKENQRKLRDLYGLCYDECGYNTTDGIFMSDLILTSFPRQMTFGTTPRQSLSRAMVTTPELVRRMVGMSEQLGESGIFIRTREYTEGVLRDYGLEQITDLRREDFMWEDLGIEV